MSVIDSAPTSDNLIVGIIREIVKVGASPKRSDANNNRKNNLFAALFAALFLVVSNEAYKVVLRKNIGKYALSMLGVITSSLMFLIWAYVMSFILYFTNFYSDGIDDYPVYVQYLCNMYILFSAIVCYVIFAIYIFIRGLDEYYRGEADTNNDLQNVLYRGDCVIFGHIADKGIDQAEIWCSHEPNACLKYALIITIIHPVIGLPFLFAAISFRVNERYHVHYKWQRLRAQFDEMNMQAEITNFVQNKNRQEPPSNEGVQ